MAHNVVLENTYSGPMDLLLYLVKRDEIDIHDIPISRLTTAYLEEIRKMQDVDVDLASEFMAMASMLMEIKSRMLLPPTEAEEGEEDEETFDPRAGLVKALLEYKRFKEAATALEGMAEEHAQRFARIAPIPKFVDPEEGDIDGVGPLDLLVAFQNLARRMLASEAQEIVNDEVPTEVRIEQIETLILQNERVLFSSMLSDAPTRGEMVGFFIAMLEMIRLGKVRARQSDDFTEIYLERPDLHPVWDPRPLPVSYRMDVRPTHMAMVGGFSHLLGMTDCGRIVSSHFLALCDWRVDRALIAPGRAGAQFFTPGLPCKPKPFHVPRKRGEGKPVAASATVVPPRTPERKASATSSMRPLGKSAGAQGRGILADPFAVPFRHDAIVLDAHLHVPQLFCAMPRPLRDVEIERGVRSFFAVLPGRIVLQGELPTAGKLAEMAAYAQTGTASSAPVFPKQAGISAARYAATLFAGLPLICKTPAPVRGVRDFLTVSTALPQACEGPVVQASASGFLSGIVLWPQPKVQRDASALVAIGNLKANPDAEPVAASYAIAFKNTLARPANVTGVGLFTALPLICKTPAPVRGVRGFLSSSAALPQTCGVPVVQASASGFLGGLVLWTKPKEQTTSVSSCVKTPIVQKEEGRDADSTSASIVAPHLSVPPLSAGRPAGVLATPFAASGRTVAAVASASPRTNVAGVASCLAFGGKPAAPARGVPVFF